MQLTAGFYGLTSLVPLGSMFWRMLFCRPESSRAMSYGCKATLNAASIFATAIGRIVTTAHECSAPLEQTARSIIERVPLAKILRVA